jgi:hypothetical protein
MNVDLKNWTIFGFVRWILLSLVVVVLLYIVGIFADENLRAVFENYGWDKILSRALATMPDILFHRETWFGSGLLIGASAMIWLVWAFPHRLGVSNANESPIKKWGTVFVIIAIIVGLGAYLHLGKQPALKMSEADIARVTAPVNKELQDAKDALAKANKEAKAAMQESLLAVDVASLPTHLRLQFTSTGYGPEEIEGANVLWSVTDATERVSKRCAPPPYDKFDLLCIFMQPNGDKNDFYMKIIHLFIVFKRPIIFKQLELNTFGVQIKTQVESQTDRFVIISIFPNIGVTTYTLEVKPVP